MGRESEEFPSRFGPFLLLKLLGAGGMGSAYLARHTNWDGYLVVKRLHQQFMEDDTVKKRFIHESKVAKNVLHPNVTSLVALGTVGRESFIATEFVFGIPFCDLLDRIEEKMTSSLPYDLLLRIAIGVAKGLEAIHQAVDVETGRPLELLHRDIGSRNILLGFDGSPRIIDLGLGKSVLSDWRTATGIFAGSPDYMPPEQALGYKVDRRGDLYSLAVTIWELLASKKRIREATIANRIVRAIEAQPEPVRCFRPEVSSQMEQVIQSCMAPNPDDRLPTVSKFKEALEREFVRVDANVTRADVVQWLDTACATILAKERRVMTQFDAQHFDFDVTDADLRQTEYLVAQPILFMSRVEQKLESGIGQPTFWSHLFVSAESKLGTIRRWWHRSPRAERRLLLAVFGIIFVLLLTIMVTRTHENSSSSIKLDVEPIPLPRRVNVIPSPPSGSDRGSKKKPRVKNRKLRSRKHINKPQRVSAMVDKLREKLVARIRSLRRRQFDVVWQKRLTELSGRVSHTETKEALDELDKKIRRMEKESE